MARKIVVGVLVTIAVIALLGFLFRDKLVSYVFKPTESPIREVTSQAATVEVIARDLETPWSVVYLPNDDLLVTERNGTMKRIGEGGRSYPIEGVRETSEGGLLGVALHPDFAKNDRLYLYYTTDQTGRLTNRIDEYSLRNNELGFTRTVLADVPAASNHNGGAIAFGPDKKLYATTGDAAEAGLAQDKSSLAGKILRLNDDGTTPSDNPFDNLVWSFGHRNPQGIAWDDDNRLWSVEHGPSGSSTGRDELNLIEKGANYGWPVITGNEQRSGMRSPVAQSGDSDTWAPAGMAYVDGSLYFAGLRGQSLYRARIDGTSVDMTRHFSEQYGRLRAVTAHNDLLTISTSNRDGRGSPAANDDKLLRINPARLVAE